MSLAKAIAKLIKKYSKHIPSFSLELYPLNKDLLFLGIDVSARKWVGFSILIFLLTLILFYVLTQGFAISIILAFLVFIYFYFLPKLEKKKREKIIEGELPLFLKDVGTLMNLGIDFKSSLQLAAKQTKETREEIYRVLRDVEVGGSITKALADTSSRMDSIIIKRAFTHLLEAYETGRGNQLREFGNELINIQTYALKEYSSKLSLFSLAFIMLSVVGPTFFIIVNILQPITGGNALGEGQFALMLLVLFPSISFALLLVSKSTLPSSLFLSSKEDFSIILLGIVLGAVMLTNLELIVKVFISLIISALFYIKYWRKKKINLDEIEKNIPNALLVISSIPEGYRVEEIFRRLYQAKLGKLSEEFKKVYKEVKANLSIEKALESMKERIPSPLVEKMVNVFIHTLKTENKISTRMSELADDMFSYISNKRERVSSLANQKYTLIVGVLLMGLVIGNVYSMAYRMGEVLEIGLYSTNYVVSYLIINSAIVSWFICSVEEKQEKAFIYFASLALVSIIIFFYIILPYA